MFQPSMTSVMCWMLFLLMSSCEWKTLVELQLKLHRSALVNFPIRLLAKLIVIGRCWARMIGHGSSSVISLLARSIDDNDERFADSSKTRSSTDAMSLTGKDSVFSWRRFTNTPSCSRKNSGYCYLIVITLQHYYLPSEPRNTHFYLSHSQIFTLNYTTPCPGKKVPLYFRHDFAKS